MEEQIITDTLSNGQIENVHIAPIGEFYGSDSKGNPVPEKITEKALKDLADKMNSGDDVLCDIDHQSCRPGAEKNTSAAGWFTNFVVDPIKGLFARLNLTKKGKELLENREYRYTSPTFMLDTEGKPVDMHSVSLTNTPAFKGFINPIINSEATAVEIKQESITDMTKEELVNLIKDTVTAMNSAPVEDDNKIKEEPKPEETENSCGELEKKEVENEDIKSDESDVKAETPAAEAQEPEKKPEDDVVTKEETKEETIKEEVIKEETLNSAPTIGADISGKAEWENLHGKEFFAYLKKHPELCRMK